MEGFGRDGRDAINESTVPGVLRGYRHFRLSSAPPDGTLLSLNDMRPYAPGFHPAECTRRTPSWSATNDLLRTHDAPQRDCTCGIYGWYNPKAIDQAFKPGYDRCTAVIEVKGRVVLGTKGFRAQAARVVAIALPEILPTIRSWRVQCDMLKSYDTAVERYDAKPYRSLGEMVEDYPPEDVSALLPATEPQVSADYAALEAAMQQTSRGMQQFREQLMRAAAQWGSLSTHLAGATSPAPGCHAAVGSLQEFEHVVASGALPFEYQAVAPKVISWDVQQLDVSVPSFDIVTAITGKVDISRLHPKEAQVLLDKSEDGRYHGVTVVVQAGLWDAGDMMHFGQYAERRHLAPKGITLEHPFDAALQMEVKLR